MAYHDHNRYLNESPLPNGISMARMFFIVLSSAGVRIPFFTPNMSVLALANFEGRGVPKLRDVKMNLLCRSCLLEHLALNAT